MNPILVKSIFNNNAIRNGKEGEPYYEPFGWSACIKLQYASQCVHAESKALELRVEKRALDTQLQSLDGQGHWLLGLGYSWVWKTLGDVSHIDIYW
jgi:hypothetical protein